MNRFEKRMSKISTSHIWANTRRCKACWKCIETCPKQVIKKVGFLWHKHIAIQNGDNCTGCKKCIKACPYGVFIEKNVSE